MCCFFDTKRETRRKTFSGRMMIIIFYSLISSWEKPADRFHFVWTKLHSNIISCSFAKTHKSVIDTSWIDERETFAFSIRRTMNGKRAPLNLRWPSFSSSTASPGRSHHKWKKNVNTDAVSHYFLIESIEMKVAWYRSTGRTEARKNWLGAVSENLLISKTCCREIFIGSFCDD